MDKENVWERFKKVRAKADETRRLLLFAKSQGDLRDDLRDELIPRLDAILHECNSFTDDYAGMFWWDPVAVRSRRVSGG